MSTQHTPGPWELKYEKTGRTIDAVIKIGKAVIYFTRGIGQTFEEQQANARLISSAPDLLSALETCVSELNQLAFLANDKLANAAIEKSIEAIRKAKGGAK